MDYLSSLVLNEVWIYKVFFCVFCTLLIDLFQKKFVRKLFLKLKSTKTKWDDVFLEAAKSPLRASIWILGAVIAFDFIPFDDSIVNSSLYQSLLDIIIVVIFAWFLARFLKLAEIEYILDKEASKQRVDKTTVHAVTKLLRLSVFITSGLVIVQSLGYSVSGLLAFGGVGGIAVGFAAKDLLANFFGGLMIHLDRPFTLGDWVASPDREIEGVVENIGWRLTVIRAFDKRPIYIPNSLFTQIVVKNPSRMSNRRIYEVIGVRYSDSSKIALITDAIKIMLENHSEIDKEQTIIVNLDKFAPSSLDIFIYAYTKTVDWVYFHQVKHEIMLEVLKIIEQLGAEAAFPTSTIYVEKKDGALN